MINGISGPQSVLRIFFSLSFALKYFVIFKINSEGTKDCFVLCLN